GDDHRHRPQGLAICGRTKGWRALGGLADALHVLLDVEQVVSARLATHIDAARGSELDELYAARGADVHDMEPTARFGCQFNRRCDRRKLRLGRPRADEVR